jgi:tetratricopeptide (TPR) repeat protein
MTDNTPSKPTVFVSYSHKDEVWKDRFIPQLRALEQAGRIVVWDDRKIDGGDKWYPEIIKAMEEALVAVCIISPDYLASGFCVKEEVPFLLQRCERDGMIFIPLLLRPCAWAAFDWLKEIQMLPRDGKNVVVDFRGIEDAAFADVANLILKIVDNPAEYELPTPPPPLWSPPEKIDIERLPLTGSELFGRQKELEMLDHAWESENTNMVSLVAWGGVGKSTLVNKWIERMQADNYRGARRVYAWSFYSQGTGERVTSADQFINHALTWFGDPDPTEGSPWDKGERLAKLIRSEKTLVVLDGLEPLQSGQAFERGKIKEPALVTLLTELARQNSGLCLITTRETVTDLYEFSDKVIQKDLEQISDEAGRALLRVGGVRGTDAELEKATREFGNHALAVNLLAVYLHDIPGHHVSHASEIPDLDIREEKGKHPRRVMAALAQSFGNGPEVELLKMLGLFDRPADKGSLRALRKVPAIHGLSDHIRKLTDAGWLRVVEKLRRYKLIAQQSQHRPYDLDAHPLVREHFGEQLKQANPESWRAGNHRLYEHLKRTTKMFPNTIEEMALLYAAIAHGCEAGRHEKALYEVYWPRVLRRDRQFSWKSLGAIAAELACIFNFFELPWSTPVTNISGESKTFVLAQAGLFLHALGYPKEAIQPLRASLSEALGRNDYINAARAAANLSNVFYSLGNLTESLSYSQQSISFADRSGETIERVGKQTTLAHILHQMNRISDAEKAFGEAEELLGKTYTLHPRLFSVGGARYCDLLLDQGKYDEVQKRVTESIEIANEQELLLDMGLDHLSLGQAYLIQEKHERTGDFDQAVTNLEHALLKLRQAGKGDELPLGLLARAELFRLKGEFNMARTDLDEAMSIATRGHMGLHQADCHLEYARLHLAMSEKENEPTIIQENREKARKDLVTAKEMIERMGYHRRDKDVQEIEAQLSS